MIDPSMVATTAVALVLLKGAAELWLEGLWQGKGVKAEYLKY